MKIFVLDDSIERITILLPLLEKMFVGADISVAATAEYAIRTFRTGHKEFDIMFLDHDLGDTVYMDSADANTGWQVAKYIVDNNIKSKQIIIHSLNYFGALHMLALLPKAKLVPFYILIDRLKNSERLS